MGRAKIASGAEIRMDQVEQVVQCPPEADYKGK
jgi:hypothetical protein